MSFVDYIHIGSAVYFIGSLVAFYLVYRHFRGHDVVKPADVMSKVSKVEGEVKKEVDNIKKV